MQILGQRISVKTAHTWISHNKMRQVSYLASTRLLDTFQNTYLEKNVFKI